MPQGNGQHGGYRRPTNPAQLSGPGQFARRTDGQPTMDMPNAAYGENASFREAQQGAPVAGAASLPNGAGGGGNPLAAIVPLGAESTDRMPVTSGAAAGGGPGPEALGLPQTPRQLDTADARALRPALEAMVYAASSPTATPSYRRLVRTVLQNL